MSVKLSNGQQLGIEAIVVLWIIFDLPLQVGGFFSRLACTGSVLDIIDTAKKVIPFALIVPGACAQRLWEQ
jgi:hypothetical protein